MPSPYRIAKHFPSRTGRINLTVPLSLAEHRALKTACDVLKFSMAGLARYTLMEILAPPIRPSSTRSTAPSASLPDQPGEQLRFK